MSVLPSFPASVVLQPFVRALMWWKQKAQNLWGCGGEFYFKWDIFTHWGTRLIEDLACQRIKPVPIFIHPLPFPFLSAFCPCSKFLLLADRSEHSTQLSRYLAVPPGSLPRSKGSSESSPFLAFEWPGQGPRLEDVCVAWPFVLVRAFVHWVHPVMATCPPCPAVRAGLSWKNKRTRGMRVEAVHSLTTFNILIFIWPKHFPLLKTWNTHCFYENLSFDINVNEIQAHRCCCWKPFFMVASCARNTLEMSIASPIMYD